MLEGLVPYANVMIKLNISRKFAEEEATKFNLVIPELEFIEVKKTRGRPKKKKKQSKIAVPKMEMKHGKFRIEFN